MEISYKNLLLLIEAMSDKLETIDEKKEQQKFAEYRQLLDNLNELLLKY